MQHSRLGNGDTECILCGETFRFYHTTQRPCAECGKRACGKCGLEYSTSTSNQHKNDQKNSNRNNDGGLAASISSSSSVTSLFTSTIGGLIGASAPEDGKDRIWLCKICAEQREMWKKSGAWFFKVNLKSLSLIDLRGLYVIINGCKEKYFSS